MKRKLNPFLLVALCSMLLCNGCASQPTLGIPNIALVAPGIYRGGQPNAEGWQYLHAAGVTNIVKLNFEAEGDDTQAQALGMHVGYFPISLLQQTLGEPAKSNLFGAVNQIRAGTFIHCSHGQDRTGLAIAVYRVQNGWSKAAAEKEMLSNGFHPWLRGLYWAWQDYIK